MKSALLVCVALAVAPVFAEDLVARNGSDSVRLNESPCTSKQVLARLQPQQHTDYKAAFAQVGGQNFEACWRVVGNSAHLLYEDGDQGLIPLAELKPDLTA
ncbi:MAG: hypothetical protein HY854_09515 [Burkholderiales bacterium]|nr:hypothetical protein [Burkholderiales bacterium]